MIYLIFIPSDNHTEGKQRGHSEYDAIIRSKIDKRVKELVDTGLYVEAWEEIKKHPKVTITIDTFFWGFVFFRTETKHKEHFTIRA